MLTSFDKDAQNAAAGLGVAGRGEGEAVELELAEFRWRIIFKQHETVIHPPVRSRIHRETFRKRLPDDILLLFKETCYLRF